MTTAIITAGGVGLRMGNEIPKQFIEVERKPIIIHTIKAFEDNSNIDQIVIVCLEEWKPILEQHIKDNEIKKVISIISGGETNFESIKKGVLESVNFNTDITIMHDGIRPNISQEVIDDTIRVCKKKGNATATTKCVEVMLYSDDGETATSHIHRDKLKRAQTPQAFHLQELLEVYDKAKDIGITNSTSLCSLMVETGKQVYFSTGSDKNIKITIPEDIDIFKAYLEIEKNNGR